MAMKKLTEKNQLIEGVITNFIEKFFDSYKKGIQQQFIAAARKRNPVLGDQLDQADENIRKAIELLRTNKYDR